MKRFIAAFLLAAVAVTTFAAPAEAARRRKVKVVVRPATSVIVR